MQIFLQDQLAFYKSHFDNKQPILTSKNTIQNEINLSFDSLTDKFLELIENQQSQAQDLNSMGTNNDNGQLQNNNNADQQDNIGEKNLNDEVPAIDGDAYKNTFSATNNNNAIDTNQQISFKNQESLDYNAKMNSKLLLKSTYLRFNDTDLIDFIESFSNFQQFNGSLIIQGQNISDQTIIRISDLLAKQDGPTLLILDLSNNHFLKDKTGVYLGESLKINSQLKELILTNNQLGTLGVNRIIESLFVNTSVTSVDFGQITNSSFQYLNGLLKQENNLCHLGFEEDTSEPWNKETKQEFLSLLRHQSQNKKIQSVNVIYQDPLIHFDFLTELSLICQKNRALYIDRINQELCQQELDFDQFDYFNLDDHQSNQQKFSVKTYLENVFNLVLDKALYNLEKERMNQLRDEQVQETTGSQKFSRLKENVFTTEGSLVNLAHFLFENLESQKTL